jgi:diacylglycerol kinase (ATP)
MAALAKAGHHATYQSSNESDYKKALKKSADLVLAAGGDGTIGKVARRLIDSGVPLGVLPLGTANNLARNLGFIGPFEEITAHLEGGKRRAFDVGLARGPWGGPDQRWPIGLRVCLRRGPFPPHGIPRRAAG